MAVNIKALNQPYLYNYKYDQLNRLIAMDAYTGLNETNNTWAALTVTNKFKERVSYDANGNIKTYVRHHEFENAPMDDLTYYYTAGTNKLTHVKEGPNSQSWINGTKDIEDQVAGNYDYDEIGNLIKDASENINSGGIEWNVYGKIQSITRSAATANNSTKQIRYDYDAAGNRIGKKVIKFGSARVEHTWYVREATGNMLGVYTAGMDTTVSTTLSNFALLHTESYLYGSSKLGVLNRMEDVEGTNYNGAMSTTWRGSKHFELSNHLGNVMAVISDKKLPVADPNNATLIAGYDAEVVSANDYYPFGMTSRSYNNGYGNYRANFNGKEKASEISSDDYDFGARIFDTRIGRWLTLDPLKKRFPGNSPFCFTYNNPVASVDDNGEKVFIVITKYSIDINEKGEMVQRPYLAAVDITKITAQELDELQIEDKKLYQAYTLAKQIGIAKSSMEKFENSEKEDLYLFQSSPKIGINSNLLHGGLTLYDVNDKDGNNKFNFSDIEVESNIDNMIYLDRFSKIEGLDFVNPSSKNHVVFINSEISNMKPEIYESLNGKGLIEDNIPSKKRAVETIAHEFIAHLIYASLGLSKDQQHDAYYGKPGGSPNDYESGSDYDKLKIQIDEKIKKE